MKNLFVLTALALSTSAQAADGCADALKARIDYAYNEGGLSLKNAVGPIYWNEGVTDENGNPGLASKVAYAISYKADREVIPDGKDGNVLVIAECVHAEPSYPFDKNNDGIFTLEDTETRGL